MLQSCNVFCPRFINLLISHINSNKEPALSFPYHEHKYLRIFSRCRRIASILARDNVRWKREHPVPVPCHQPTAAGRDKGRQQRAGHCREEKFVHQLVMLVFARKRSQPLQASAVVIPMTVVHEERISVTALIESKLLFIYA